VAATTPFDTDEGLFADRLPPSDSPARPNHEETIGWRSDEPETAPLGQRFDLFKEEHEPQVDPEDETTPTSTAEAITGPPTEAEDHVDTETENHADPSPIADPVQQVDTDIGDAQEANPAIGAEDHTGVDFDIDTDIGDAQDDGPPTDTEDHTVTDHDIGDHDTGPPTEATQQIDTDTPGSPPGRRRLGFRRG
jgi:hypothetical protein